MLAIEVALATAAVDGALLAGILLLVHVAAPAALAAGLAVYAVLIGLFASYRRHLRTLQPAVPLLAPVADEPRSSAPAPLRTVA